MLVPCEAEVICVVVVSARDSEVRWDVAVVGLWMGLGCFGAIVWCVHCRGLLSRMRLRLELFGLHEDFVPAVENFGPAFDAAVFEEGFQVLAGLADEEEVGGC